MPNSIPESIIVHTTKGNFILRDEDAFLRLVSDFGPKAAVKIAITLRILRGLTFDPLSHEKQ